MRILFWAGVTGTPTTLIRNNRTGALEVVTGAQRAEAVAGVIDRLFDVSR